MKPEHSSVEGYRVHLGVWCVVHCKCGEAQGGAIQETCTENETRSTQHLQSEWHQA